MSVLRHGALALIDALGFRGVWQRHSSEVVVRSLENLKATLQQRIAQQFQDQPGYECKIAFISDTIAVSMSIEDLSFGDSNQAKHRDALAVIYLGDVLRWIIQESLTSEVPFLYRGVITSGEYYVSNNFLLGPAVDEAAQLYEIAEAPLIWLSPKADRLVLERQLDWAPASNTFFVRFPVPIKGGGALDTFTVSPLELGAAQDKHDHMIQTIYSSFGAAEKIDVSLKRQIAIDHIEACCKWAQIPPPDLRRWRWAHFNES